MEKIKQQYNPERGKNIDLTIRLMRHGKKNPDGTLSEIGAQEAQERGANMEPFENVKAYTSDVSRVAETAKSVQEGVEIHNQFEQRTRRQLSATLLRAPDSKKPSHFFKEVVLKRLADANTTPIERREQNIREVEHQNMQEWLSYDDKLVDETTNSPKNVARAVAHFLIRQIDMADRLKKDSDVDFLDVTHEFMLAAIIKYAVEKQNDDGTIATGEKIMQEKKSIDYLESLDINVHIDNDGNKKISLTINSEHYILNMDSLRALANEYIERVNKHK